MPESNYAWKVVGAVSVHRKEQNMPEKIGYLAETGDTVEAFHPRMLGVVKTGRVESSRARTVRVDFGDLLGGTFVVSREHITAITQTADTLKSS